jgi:adenylate kinase
MIYVFLGVQGSGKGTQSKFLSDHFGLDHISLGEIFRKEIANNTELGKVAKKYLVKGGLVPDQKVLEIVDVLFIMQQKGFVFDGFPRTLRQAEYLTEKHHVDKVIYLELDDNVARERMAARRICVNCRKDYNLLVNPPKVKGKCDVCGSDIVRRADDTDELIQNRLDLFHKETKPLTEYYEKMGLLCVVNAIGDIHFIHEKILDEI